jgi:hypothetical protein
VNWNFQIMNVQSRLGEFDKARKKYVREYEGIFVKIFVER